MELYEISKQELEYLIHNDELLKDDYRAMYYHFDAKNSLGFYYNEFYGLEEQLYNDSDEVVKLKKQLFNSFEHSWEYYTLLPKITLINRLEELKNKGLSEIKESQINGLALYQGYPVGVIMPKTFCMNYKPVKFNDISLLERKIIMDKATKWVEELMKNDVYPINIREKNIVARYVNSDIDVMLDGLDKPGTVRIESKGNIDYLKRNGHDLAADSFENLNNIKKLVLK